MKVYDIVKLTEDLDIRSVNGGYEIFDTETGSRARNTIIYPDEGSAETARDRIRAANRPSPTADPDDRVGGRPRVPTTDKLSRGERLRLRVTGRITRGGVTYSRAQIAAADAEAERIRNSNPDSRNRNPTPPSDTPDNTPDDVIKRVAKGFWNSTPMRWLRRLLGPGAANAINAAINAAAIEDALDAYLRAFVEYSNSLEGPERQRFLQAIEAAEDGDISVVSTAVSPELLDAYLECVERISQLLIEAIIGIAAGAGGAAIMAIVLAKVGLATGGIGIILALIGGGALAIGGTALLYRLLEETGATDLIENHIVSKMITFGGLYFFARGVDGFQDTFGALADVSLELPSNTPGVGALVPNVGDMVRDNENDDDADRQELPQINSDEVVRKLKRLVKSNPELMQAYHAGKEEAKEILRSISNQR